MNRAMCFSCSLLLLIEVSSAASQKQIPFWLSADINSIEWQEGCLTTVLCSHPRFQLLEDLLPVSERLSISWPVTEQFLEHTVAPFISYWPSGRIEDVSLSAQVVGVDTTYGFPRTCDQTPAVRIFPADAYELASDGSEKNKTIHLKAKCFEAAITVTRHTDRCPWCLDPKDVLISNEIPQQSVSAEGMSTVELHNSLCNTKTRNLLHDAIRTSYAFTVPEWLKYASESVRLPIPIRESRRFRVALDEEYFPGQLVKMESTEYIFAQAPVKKSARMIWKAAQQERIRLMVCLCHDEQMTTDDDDTKCFTWFPTEPDQSIEIEQQKKGTYTVVCKSREGLSMGAIKYELELTDSEAVIDKNSDDPNAANEKIQKIVLYHMNTWTGLKPETGNALEKAHDIAIFSREVKKHELDVLRKSMENYVPPVLIQSFDGINRSATLWVALMLLRDCEMRECFDVPGLIKSIMKMRIGSLSTYFQFCFCMAVCLNIGKDTKWCENDCSSALTDLTNKFGERKVNENGYLLAH